MILTQQQFCAWLREQGLRTSPSMVHHCIDAGMPVVRLPWAKKPRFDTEQAWPWLVATRSETPLALAVRDKIFRQSRRTIA